MSESKFDKVACEDCGEMVSIHHLSQAKHKRECKMKPVEENNTVVEVKKDVAPEIADEQAKIMYDVAMRAQETRKKSPELFVAGVHSDERRELIKRYAPECINPPFNPLQELVKNRKFAEWHAFWSSPEKALSKAHKAYIPVFNEHKMQVQNKGDLLFKIQRKMFMDVQTAASEESKARLALKTDEKLKELEENAGEGITISSSKTEEVIQ